MFSDYDQNSNGSLSRSELEAMMAKIGLATESKYSEAMLRAIDTNNNGTIEFEEFTRYMIYDLYKWHYYFKIYIK